MQGGRTANWRILVHSKNQTVRRFANSGRKLPIKAIAVSINHALCEAGKIERFSKS